MEEIVYKIEELQSMVNVLSISLETTTEHLSNKDISNVFSLIEDRLNDIKKELTKV